MDKALIRQKMKEQRLLYSQETLLYYSQLIEQQIFQHPLYQNAKIIGIYVSLPMEVNTIHLIQESLNNHRVCVPKVEGDIMNFYEITSLDDLKEGCFHVLEPMTVSYIDSQEIDLMIVPLLAYDKELYRVGYGKGFYDKYFASGFCGYKLGLAFDFQYVDHIDRDKYDYPLDEIIHLPINAIQ